MDKPGPCPLCGEAARMSRFDETVVCDTPYCPMTIRWWTPHDWSRLTVNVELRAAAERVVQSMTSIENGVELMVIPDYEALCDLRAALARAKGGL
jgi:hypothetical protein